jgi:hypothetical protein
MRQKLTPAQQLMINDGFPAELLMTAEERQAAWARNPPKAVEHQLDRPREESAATIALRAELSAQAKLKTNNRKTKKEKIALDTTGMRWNQRQAKWISDYPTPTNQETTMAGKIKLQAFDAEKEVVYSPCTTLPEAATPEDIEAAVNKAMLEAGVIFVCVTGIGGEAIGAWALQGDTITRDDSLYFTKPMPKKSAKETPVTKTKATKAKATSKAKANVKKPAKVAKKTNGNGELRAGSKTEIVANLLKRKSGCTRVDILEATGWPAVSVPAMAKAAGLKLRKEKMDDSPGKPTRYYGS